MCIFRTSNINRNKELKSLFFCYWSSSAKHVWIFIFQSILNLTINNLLKPLLSKPETKLIQRKYETILLFIYWKLILLFIYWKWTSTCGGVPKTFFGSHDTYVVTYEAIYVSTKIEL